MTPGIHRIEAETPRSPCPSLSPWPPLSRLHISSFLENSKPPSRLSPRSPHIRVPIPASYAIVNIARIPAVLVAPASATANTAVAGVGVLLGFARSEASEEDDEHAEEEEEHGGENGPHSHRIVGVRARVVGVDVVFDDLLGVSF